MRLRWLALSLGFEKLTLKKETLRGYIPTENKKRTPGQVFGNILKYVQAHPRRSRLKELKGKLDVIVEQVVTLKDAREVLEGLKMG